MVVVNEYLLDSGMMLLGWDYCSQMCWGVYQSLVMMMRRIDMDQVLVREDDYLVGLDQDEMGP